MTSRILVIEDNTSLRELYHHVLSQDGFDVTTAEDGQKGLALAQANKPDLILLDLMLPKMSGSDVLLRLRADPDTAGIPILIFSAAGDPAEIQKLKQVGATDYAIKSTSSPKQMLSRIRNILEGAPSKERVRLPVSGGKADVSLLAGKTGLPTSLSCPHCRTEYFLEMGSLPHRTDGHWFQARLICPGCERAA